LKRYFATFDSKGELDSKTHLDNYDTSRNATLAEPDRE
jgi:hypothetical protein